MCVLWVACTAFAGELMVLAGDYMLLELADKTLKLGKNLCRGCIDFSLTTLIVPHIDDDDFCLIILVCK